MSARASGAGKALKIGTGFVTMAMVVAAFGYLGLVAPEQPVDTVTTDGSSTSQLVSQQQLTAYCPARMTLPDAASYGDSEYQPSEGDIASAARYAAFGAVYQSRFGAFADTSSQRTTLADSDPTDSSNVLVASGDTNAGATLFSTQLLEAAQGAGETAAVLSSASKGDLRGLSAASCQAPALSHSFMISSTKTGSTQQLIVANPSAKATTVDVRAWGTTARGPIVFSTGSTLTVGAGSESTLDLSAAASGQDALYVTVTSKETPVAAVVRSVRMDGLTAKGSDWEVPLADASNDATFPGLAEGDAVTLMLYAKTAGTVSTHWIGADSADSKNAADTTHEYRAGTVTVIDLAKAPKGAQGLSIESESDVSAAVRVVRSGADGQEDFALINPAQPAASTAIAIPDGAKARISVISRSAKDSTVTLHAYDDQGKALGSKDVELETGKATSLNAADIADGTIAVITLDDGEETAWGARLSSDALDKAKVAGVAWLASTSLMPRQERVQAHRDMTIVR
ncbi:hypothetical protein D2E25_0306 [Bifidobacterium goeldii]|uniref:Organic solvents resistance ABC transporter permease n=1 Tax=Bifidobacterium goeldii TaxID=2306975 RepID=A0A430FMJ2_9BIFI|nr:DUF5719 family protein [Bifidobacterium goeldii]RSX54000.1 hypothetical protein D2E25_0306 [Bifidobacterium goeldii]